MNLSKQNSSITIIFMIMLSLSQATNTQDKSNNLRVEDPYLYLDESGQQMKIQNLTEEFYFERLHTVKLEGSTGETVYWVNLYMGSPPQKQTAIIDTGSSLLAFPCSECKSECGNHLNKQYNLTESYTSQKMACSSTFGNFNCQRCGQDKICQWGVSYMEGSSIGGFMALDYVVFGDEIQDYLNAKALKNITDEQDTEYLMYMNHERVQLPFGCTTKETHLFKTQVPDGIIGLAPSSNTSSNPPTIIDRIFQQHGNNNEQLVFSLCLNSHEGGFMSIGGYNHELHLDNAKTQIINFIPNTGFYDVKVKQVRMGDQVITTNIPKPILDSGTTLVFGPAGFINPLIDSINTQCSSGKYKCGNAKNSNSQQTQFLYTKSQEFPTVQDFFDSFPTFLFDFESDDGIIAIEWKAHGYLYIDPDNRNPNLYQFAFESYSTQKVYLGGPFFKNYDILFDKNKHKVHFTPSNCTLPHINSVLMNTHSSKIRKTMMDSQFIDELREFQKTFNYTPKYENKTDKKNKDIDGEDNKGQNSKGYEKYYKFVIFTLFFLISIVILCLCKRTVTEEKDLIPLQSMENGQMQFDSHVQVSQSDKDEQLKSEEDDRDGYKNDPTYKPEELNRDDGENQYNNQNQNDEETERRTAIQD